MINYIPHKSDLFHWADPFIALFYIIIIFIIVIFIRGHFINKKPEYKYLIKGVIIKTIGAIIFTLIYLFYYDDGDTILYFEGARTLGQILIDNPTDYFRLIISSHNFDPSLMYIRGFITYSKSPEEWFMVKLLSPLALLSFNRFLVAQILMSFITFFGSWKLFQTFLIFYPKMQKAAFISVFMLPSVLLWGSGILKDSVTFAFLSIFFYYSVKALYLYQFKLKYYLIIILSIYMIFNIKAYIILSFLPILLIGWVAQNRKRIKSKFFRLVLTPFIISIAIFGGLQIVENLQAESEKYAMENLQSRAEGFHNWHTVLGGSSYSLGAIDYTTWGIIKKIPGSFNVTFFRPYITEVYNVAMAIGAIESTVLLLIFLLLLYWYRFSWLKEVFKNPLLVLSFFYSIVFGFIVGFTSYNFGALARYKIPVMPFFTFLLLYFYFDHKNKMKAKNPTIVENK